MKEYLTISPCGITVPVTGLRAQETGTGKIEYKPLRKDHRKLKRYKLKAAAEQLACGGR
jgi:hypothetical protein